MAVQLTVHRATQEIGGNCIELCASNGDRIFLDVGRPLHAGNDQQDLLPATVDRSRCATAVIISHPHQDHYGLLNELSLDWPVYCGKATEQLIQMTGAITGSTLGHSFHTWASGQPFMVGSFRITPFLTDHSAFDAHMLLIEIEGKRLLYTGDFRAHGRKASLVEAFMDAPPPDLDVLLMEGTNLGSDKPCTPESALEDDFRDLFARTAGRVFVVWSAQNIDRTVTLYRACLKAGRTLVIDLYTAEVLNMLAKYGKIPQPDWKQINVVITSAFARMYRNTGRSDFVERMARNGIAARALAGTPGKWVVMLRASLMRDFVRAGIEPCADDAWSWSMWRGYLTQPDGKSISAWFTNGGTPACHIHSSGHASASDLRAFANAMRPAALVPIHGEAWDRDAEGFPPIKRILDGELLLI
ncbi:MBL fold metallo-hydrolase [Variovorax sp. YR216]|uniref:MBL fold metallo-hydrolase n=1 Tax=Variovorax sp. YR216 TaxID=1882828 RepID=UPI0008953E2A|nr:MBL fold metallo-hydrolase [Variovorax sp. YR216]SEB22415.1 ribonuclease J [Variovorax sp. YR216]